MSSWKKTTYYDKCDSCGVVVVDNFPLLNWIRYYKKGKAFDLCDSCGKLYKWPNKSCNHKNRHYHRYVDGDLVKLCGSCFGGIKCKNEN